MLHRVTRLDPRPSAWDFAFSSGDRHFVRVTLRGGERIGGLFGSRSFASAYPEPRELFLEEAWRLSERGDLEAPIAGNRGLLIAPEQIEVIEFVRRRERRGKEAP